MVKFGAAFRLCSMVCLLFDSCNTAPVMADVFLITVLTVRVLVYATFSSFGLTISLLSFSAS